MENNKIKELFLSNKNNPFRAKDFYNFFGFSRYDNFSRFISNEKYVNETIGLFDIEKGKFKQYFSRELFLKLAEIKLNNRFEFEGYYFEYKINKLKRELLNFKYTKKKENRNELKGYITTDGYFYTYSLDSNSLADFLNICPFDLFKHISDNYSVKYGFCNYTFLYGSYSMREKPVPIFYFNQVKHEERYRFIICIDNLIKDYQLTNFQERLLKKYRQLVSEMLIKQYEYDFIKQNAEKKRAEKRQKNQGYKSFSYISGTYKTSLTEVELKEIKILYRKAAFICHPDKNSEGEELFKDLNNANSKNDLHRVKEIYNQLIKNKSHAKETI